MGSWGGGVVVVTWMSEVVRVVTNITGQKFLGVPVVSDALFRFSNLVSSPSLSSSIIDATPLETKLHGQLVTDICVVIKRKQFITWDCRRNTGTAREFTLGTTDLSVWWLGQAFTEVVMCFTATVLNLFESLTGFCVFKARSRIFPWTFFSCISKAVTVYSKS
jgi:hypothetical protein